MSVPIEVDLRVGGTWRQQMVIDADTQYMTGGVYAEIVPHRRLAFYWGAAGGWPSLDPERLWDSPVCTVELEPVAGRYQDDLQGRPARSPRRGKGRGAGRAGLPGGVADDGRPDAAGAAAGGLRAKENPACGRSPRAGLSSDAGDG